MGIIADIWAGTLPSLLGGAVDFAGDKIFGEGDYGWGPNVSVPQPTVAPVAVINAPAVIQPTVVRPTVIQGTGGVMRDDCAPLTQKQVVTYDCATGAILKISKYKRRRRRRRLATASDIADLEALKGILGKGQALSSYLAVYGRK